MNMTYKCIESQDFNWVDIYGNYCKCLFTKDQLYEQVDNYIISDDDKKFIWNGLLNVYFENI